MGTALAPGCACASVSSSTLVSMCNQSGFGTLQEVISSQDYCVSVLISKVLHNSLCSEGLLNWSTWKRKRDVRFVSSCRSPSASSSASTASLLCKGGGFWTSKLPRRWKQLVRDLTKGTWKFMASKKITWTRCCVLWAQRFYRSQTRMQVNHVIYCMKQRWVLKAGRRCCFCARHLHPSHWLQHYRVSSRDFKLVF